MRSVCLIGSASASDSKGSSLFLKCECIIYACRDLSAAAVLLCFKIRFAPFENMRINVYLNQKKNVWKHFCITAGLVLRYAALSHANTQIMKRQ